MSRNEMSKDAKISIQEQLKSKKKSLQKEIEEIDHALKMFSDYPGLERLIKTVRFL